MTDINVIVGFEPDESSVRRLTTAITRAIRDTKPEIDLKLNEDVFTVLRQQLRGIALEDLRIDSGALQELNHTLSAALRPQIQRFEVGEKALRDARSRFQKALENVRIAQIKVNRLDTEEAEIRRTRSRPVEGAVGAQGPRQQIEGNVGRAIGGLKSQARKQELIALKELASAEQEQALVINALGERRRKVMERDIRSLDALDSLWVSLQQPGADLKAALRHVTRELNAQRGSVSLQEGEREAGATNEGEETRSLLLQRLASQKKSLELALAAEQATAQALDAQQKNTQVSVEINRIKGNVLTTTKGFLTARKRLSALAIAEGAGNTQATKNKLAAARSELTALRRVVEARNAEAAAIEGEANRVQTEAGKEEGTTKAILRKINADRQKLSNIQSRELDTEKQIATALRQTQSLLEKQNFDVDPNQSAKIRDLRSELIIGLANQVDFLEQELTGIRANATLEERQAAIARQDLNIRTTAARASLQAQKEILRIREQQQSGELETLDAIRQANALRKKLQPLGDDPRLTARAGQDPTVNQKLRDKTVRQLDANIAILNDDLRREQEATRAAEATEKNATTIESVNALWDEVQRDTSQLGAAMRTLVRQEVDFAGSNATTLEALLAQRREEFNQLAAQVEAGVIVRELMNEQAQILKRENDARRRLAFLQEELAAQRITPQEAIGGAKSARPKSALPDDIGGGSSVQEIQAEREARNLLVSSIIDEASSQIEKAKATEEIAKLNARNVNNERIAERLAAEAALGQKSINSARLEIGRLLVAEGKGLEQSSGSLKSQQALLDRQLTELQSQVDADTNNSSIIEETGKSRLRQQAGLKNATTALAELGLRQVNLAGEQATIAQQTLDAERIRLESVIGLAEAISQAEQAAKEIEDKQEEVLRLEELRVKQAERDLKRRDKEIAAQQEKEQKSALAAQTKINTALFKRLGIAQGINAASSNLFDQLQEGADTLTTTEIGADIGGLGASLRRLSSKILGIEGEVRSPFQSRQISAIQNALSNVAGSAAALEAEFAKELDVFAQIGNDLIALEASEDSSASIAERRNRLSERALATEKRLASLKDEIWANVTKEARLSARLATTRSASGGGGGPGRPPDDNDPPNTVVIRSAADITKFSKGLNVEQLREFTTLLNEVARGTKGAKQQLDAFGNSVQKGASQQSALNSRLQEGQGLAFDFGRQVSLAARRLLAWATPAQLIFATIGALRRAVDQIVEIDREARRLIFFQNAGGIITSAKNAVGDFAGEIDNLGRSTNPLDSLGLSVKDIVDNSRQLVATSETLSNQFNTIAASARRYGLALSDVTEAFVTISRVGQDVIDKTTGQVSAFASAVLSLIRLEGAAIGATEAVRGLQAIQAQFFGGRTGARFEELAGNLDSMAISAQLTSNAMAILTATSAGSAASVSELIDAVTRLGSAFVNIQGLNFPQTVAIVGEAFTVTGATTGRLATALRQTATLIAQNASEIKELTGIDVVGADGTIRDFTAILDVLQRVRDEAGSLASTEISLLIADRRNVADIQALAQNVDVLRASYERFDDPVSRVNRVMQAQAAVMAATEESASSLEAQMNDFNTAIVELTSSAGFTDMLTDIVAIGKLGINVISEIIQAVQTLDNIAGGFTAVFAGIGVGLVVKAVFDMVKGFREAAAAVRSMLSPMQQITRLVKDQKTATEGISLAQQQGLITVKQEEKALRVMSTLRAKGLALQEKARQIELQIVGHVDTGIASQRVLAGLRKEQFVTGQGIAAVQKAEVSFAKRQIKEARKLQAIEQKRAQALQRGLFAAIAVAGSASVAFKQLGQEGIADGINDGILGVSAAAAAGAGPWGTLAAAMASLLTGAIRRGAAEGLRQAERDAAAGSTTLNSLGTADAAAQRAKRAIEGELTQTTDNSTRVDLRAQLAQIEELRKEIFDLETKGGVGEGKRSVVARAAGDVAELNPLLKEYANEIDSFLQDTLGGGDKKELSAEDATRLATLRAGLAEAVATADAARQEREQATEAARQREVAKNILQDNVRLAGVILSVNSTAEEVARAKLVLDRNANRLQEERFAQMPLVQEAEARINATLAARQGILENLNRTARNRETILSALRQIPTGKTEALELEIQINQQAFDNAIEDAEKRIEAVNRSARASGSREEAEAARKNADKERAAIEELRRKRVGELIGEQKKILDNANNDAVRQIAAWEEAATKVVDAFSGVISAQREMAGIFKTIGQVNSEIALQTSRNVAATLDATGASIATRLRALNASSSSAINQARASFGGQRSTLGERFSNTGQIAQGVENVIATMARVFRDSDEAIANERRGFVSVEAARNKTEAEVLQRLTRAQFNERIKETRREIAIRRTLIGDEIKLMQQRFDSERELHQMRREQLEEFGQLLIESPEEFEKTLKEIGTATRFFSNVTDISASSLRTIQQRVQRLQRGGSRGQDANREILAGIQAAIQFGEPDIVSGVGNEQLEEIFSRVQRENVDAITHDLERQRAELNSQTQLQKEIRERQQELLRLAEFDASIQSNLINLAQAEAQLAATHQTRQLQKLEDIRNANKDARDSFVSGIQAVVALLAGQITADDARARGETPDERSFIDGIATTLRDILPNQGSILDEITGGRGGEGSILDEIDGRRAGTDAARFLAEDIAANLNNFLSQDSAAVQDVTDETDKLREATSRQTQELQDAIKATRDFSNGLRGAQGDVDEAADNRTRAGRLTDTLRSRGFDQGPNTDRFRFQSQELEELRAKQGLSREEKNRLAELRGADGLGVDAQRELQGLEGREGNQLNRSERRRLRELERQERRGFRTDSTGGRQLAGQLLGGAERGDIIKDFRTTLADDQNVDGEFIDRVRRLRGEGRRGERNIDVGAVKQLLGGAGFEGVARGIQTKGQAADALDKFIQLSERLADEQGEISRGTQQRIIKILGEELVPGIADVIKRTGDAAEEAAAGRADDIATQGAALTQAVQEGFAKITTEAFSDEQLVKMKEAISIGAEGAGNMIALTVGQALDEGAQKLGETRVGVDVGEITANIAVRTPDALDLAGLTNALAQALSPVVGNGEKLEAVVNQLSKLLEELVRKGMIRPILGIPDFIMNRTLGDGAPNNLN